MTYTAEAIYESIGSGYSTVPDSILEIESREIEILKVLGHGTFGIVEKAEWNIPDDKAYIVAVKTANAQKDFKNELHKLAELKHTNIIRLFGITTIRSKIALVMEYAECGSLYSFLHPDSSNQPPVKYSFAHVISWSLQCAKAMEYLHSIPIVHRDLKPPNILLADYGRVLKICDFGTASYLRPEMSHSKGSIKWMAPEVSKGCHYTEKCDVYSFGIVLWEMLTRKKPYDDIERVECILFKVHAGVRPHPVEGIPDCLNTLMKRCWDENPSIRPSFTEILQYFEKCTKEKKIHGVVEPLAMFDKTNVQGGCNVENDDVPPEVPPKLQKHRVADNISKNASEVKEEKSSNNKDVIDEWMHQHDSYPNVFNNESNVHCAVDTQTEFNFGPYFVNCVRPFSPLFDLVDSVTISEKLITKQNKDLNGVHNLPQVRKESKVSLHSTSISQSEAYSKLLDRRKKLQQIMEELDTKKENIKNKRKQKKEKLKKEKQEIENIRTTNQVIKGINGEGNDTILPPDGKCLSDPETVVYWV